MDVIKNAKVQHLPTQPFRIFLDAITAADKPREVVEDQIMETGIDDKAEVKASKDLVHHLMQDLVQK